jgi:hypothetical protein
MPTGSQSFVPVRPQLPALAGMPALHPESSVQPLPDCWHGQALIRKSVSVGFSEPVQFWLQYASTLSDSLKLAEEVPLDTADGVGSDQIAGLAAFAIIPSRSFSISAVGTGNLRLLFCHRLPLSLKPRCGLERTHTTFTSSSRSQYSACATSCSRQPVFRK